MLRLFKCKGGKPTLRTLLDFHSPPRPRVLPNNAEHPVTRSPSENPRFWQGLRGYSGSQFPAITPKTLNARGAKIVPPSILAQPLTGSSALTTPPLATVYSTDTSYQTPTATPTNREKIYGRLSSYGPTVIFCIMCYTAPIIREEVYTQQLESAGVKSNQ